MRRLILLGGVLLVALLAIAACSSDDDNDGDGGDQSSQAQSEPSGLTEEEAKALSQAALLVLEDLPESEWEIEETEGSTEEASEDETPLRDEAEDDDDPFEGVPECAAFEEVSMNDFGVLENLEPVAESTRTFSTTGADGFSSVEVESNIAVFNSEADARAVFDRFEQTFDIDTLKPCFEAAFGGDVFVGADIGELDVEEADTADDGTAIRLRLEAELGPIAFNLLVEFHVFRYEFAAAFLIVNSLNGDEFGDLKPKKLAQLMQDRLKSEID